jgi:hypothetical protein
MVLGSSVFKDVEATDGDPVLDIGGVGGEALCTVVVCDCSGVCNMMNCSRAQTVGRGDCV